MVQKTIIQRDIFDSATATVEESHTNVLTFPVRINFNLSMDMQ